MSDTGRPGPERPTPPPITSWQAQPPTTPVPPTPSPSAGPAPTTPAFARVPGTPAPAPQASTAPTVEQEPPAAASSGRPRWLIPVIIGVIVLVAAAIIIAIVTSSKGDSTDTPPPAAASTVLLPSPTPTVAPVARTATTAFASALPTSVLQYALATSAADTEWQGAGAIEAYTETYTDGAAGTVTVNAGQWETAPEATAFAASIVASLPAAPAAGATEPAATASAEPGAPTFPQSGDVSAGGAAVGTYTIVDAGDGTGVAVWTNGSSVFQVTAPLADIVDVYSAYPL